MPNYQNTKIYKLWTHLNDEIYIGSTTLTLAQRLAKHKSTAKKTTKGRSCSSCVLFENEGKVMIELIEEFSCENRMMACKREGELIRANPCINKNIAGRDHKEFMKQYYETHKEQIKESMKEYSKKYYLKCKEEKKHLNLMNTLETFDI